MHIHIQLFHRELPNFHAGPIYSEKALSLSYCQQEAVFQIIYKRLPFVHNVSIVIHKMSAEGAKWTQVLKWDFFWCKHDALQNSQSGSTLTHKACTHSGHFERNFLKSMFCFLWYDLYHNFCDSKCITQSFQIVKPDIQVKGLFVLMSYNNLPHISWHTADQKKYDWFIL